MPVEVRVCGPDEVGAALTPIWHYFGRTAHEEDVERIRRILPAERLHAAYLDGSIVGGAGAYALELTVPGPRLLAAAGVMAVGVLPTHRRRGILNELTRVQLEAVRTRGEPLAVLFASEGAIYRRFGYGVASLAGDIDLAREHAAFRGPAECAAARLVTHEEALDVFPAVYDRVQADTPGMFVRSRDWWEIRRLTPRPWMRAGEVMCVLIELDGAPAAYAIYRIEPSIEHGVSKGVVEVVEAMGATPAATRHIWAYLLSIDFIERIRAYLLPPDHPLFLLLVEPRRMCFTMGEALWVRLVDVGEALSARGYSAPGELVVFSVRDEFCPWNEGNWRVSRGIAERTKAEADLALDIADLGSVYLGGFTFADLGAAGRVEELREGAIARADALFRTDRRPWCPEIF